MKLKSGFTESLILNYNIKSENYNSEILTTLIAFSLIMAVHMKHSF